MGRIEARPTLASLLREEPSEEVFDAVSSVADEECIVLLGRIARSTSALSDAALSTLESIDDHSCQRDCDSDPGTRFGQNVSCQRRAPCPWRIRKSELAPVFLDTCVYRKLHPY